MRAVLVIVADVFREQSFQVAFIHGDNVIQQVPSAAFDPTLRDAVLPGTFESIQPHGSPDPRRIWTQRASYWRKREATLLVNDPLSLRDCASPFVVRIPIV